MSGCNTERILEGFTDPFEMRFQPLIEDIQRQKGDLEGTYAGMVLHESTKALHGNVEALHGNVKALHGSVEALHGSVGALHGNVAAFRAEHSSKPYL